MEKELKKAVSDLQRAIKKDNFELMTKSVNEITAILSQDWYHLPIEQIFKTNLIEILVNYLKEQNSEPLSLIREFLRILVNITYADEASVAEKVVDLGLIRIAASYFVQHKDFEVKEHAIAILGNIALDSLEYREKIIEEESDNIFKAVSSEQIDTFPVSFCCDLSLVLRVLFLRPSSTALELVSKYFDNLSLINCLVDSFLPYYPRSFLEI